MSLLLLLLVGCGGIGNDPDASYRFDEFIGEAGLEVEYGRGGQSVTGLLLYIDGDWELRWGENWATATDSEVVPVETDDGLRLDGTLILPGFLRVGAALEGTTVTEVGATETWYGTFEETVTVSVDEGRFAGTHVFARELGPIVLTVDGESWQLLYYE